MGLYVALKPIHVAASALGLVLRVIENAVAVGGLLFGFAGLALMKQVALQEAASSEGLITTGHALLRMSGEGQAIAHVYLGAGSIVFSWLWFRSRYVPRALAVLGLLASSILAAVSLAALVFPSIWSKIGLSYMMPMFFYEVGLGFWLLFKGLRSVETAKVQP